ncbi:c-type cytochrome [Rhodoplanes sp. Z2-YC6860]|uniref:c-type cytochrome n=1 Tax=Rhodoplanes sp. Z2-YC6860 TaxID=674703 RepID=UPI00078B6963|nr:cytochrome c [Rhodoplanes sp. Z2-YC6860]AMN38503.1 cytochrome C-552 [Rhodoplanes sp. Z2-YC6860]
MTSPTRVCQKAIVAVLIVLMWSAPSTADALTLQRRGQTLAKRMCGQCHAIGKSGESPRAGAPRFAHFGDRLDLSTFARRLRRGLLPGHEDMPMFRFSRPDADALAAYVRSIQQ